MSKGTVGEVLGSLVDDQLADERQLKDSLMQRSTLVISTSGALVTLSLGISALVTRTQTYHVPGMVLVCVGIALGFLVAGALVSLLVNAAWQQGSLDTATMSGAGREDTWTDSDMQLAIEAHRIKVELIAKLRTANARRAWLLSLALGAECIAILALAVAVVLVLTTR